jgi:EAL and modified HD-GYP domain-containing signal transduction protein
LPGHTDVVVGRQAIHSADGVVGYELLLTTISDAASAQLTGGELTADLIFSAVSVGLNRLTAERLIFCRASRAVLIGALPVMLPAHRTIIEIPDESVRDNADLTGAKTLADAGYRLAVRYTPRWTSDPLRPLISYLKVDASMAPARRLARTVRRCRDRQVWATNVADRTELDRLAGLGVELFQGRGLDRLSPVAGRPLRPSVVTALAAAAHLLGTEPSFDQLEDILRRDPALASQTMQLAALGRMGELRRTIGSLRDALVMAGLVQITNWLIVLLACRAAPRGDTHGAVLATLLRARVCELLAAELDVTQAQLGFAAGLLSALEFIVEVPLVEIVDTLPLTQPLREAALGGDTALGRVVHDVINYRTGVDGPALRSGLTRAHFDAAFARAFPWAMECAAAAAPA